MATIDETLATLTQIEDGLTKIERAKAWSARLRERCDKLGVAAPVELDAAESDIAAAKVTVK